MKLRLAAVFGDGMVLQRDVPVPVWGTAPAGTEVTVELDGVSAQVRTGQDGRWMAHLPAAPAGGPYLLSVSGGGETLRREQVYRGEVWLAGGQSNMEMLLERSQDGEQAVRDSGNPRLHFCTVPKSAWDPPEELSWHTASPETAGGLSAVAYYAGRTLTEHLQGVHVGVIVCCWGATYAHCWTSRSALERFPEGRARIDSYETRIAGKSDAVFDREQAAYQAQLDAWNADPQGPYPWPPPAGRTSFHRPGNLYRAMVKPLAPYALRGFWYYQGEQDEEWPEDYFPLLTALIDCWRETWENQSLPFLLAQLPMYQSEGWPVLRKAQADAARTLPGVEMAVLADCGEADNVHPLDKRTPGTRLGLLALEAVYGQPVTGQPPVCVSACREGHAVRLRFDHTGGGLVLSSGGFQLAEADGAFVPADAQVISPDTVRVTAPGLSEPVSVRYAWYSFGPAGLHGGSGLAAAPLNITL